MKLYHIQFDGQSWWVEADSIGSASEKWLAHVRSEPDNADFSDEPDSVHRVHDEPVIR